jgi:N-acetylglucosamine-6-phosphate deacetylase
MVIRENDGQGKFLARDCLSGIVMECRFEAPFVSCVPSQIIRGDIPFIGPGLVDLQVNGVNGVDFNDTALSGESLLTAAGYLLRRGVTTFYPAVITNSAGNIRKILAVINEACANNPLLDQCIGGIHLEGPFISAHDGFRGAHARQYVTAPDWELFSTFQKASGGRIRIITLSPEWDTSSDFIRKCRKAGIIVSIAHSAADSRQLTEAVNAGASLSTHIGNSVPLMLPRHPNIIWDMLAEERIYASIIADGYHLPDSFIKVVMKTKGKKAILVSDTTYFSGMKPGSYKAHIGNEVILEKGGRLSIKGSNGLLAGAAKLLIENVQYLLDKKLADLSLAWYMASAGPAELTGINGPATGPAKYPDSVLFNVIDGSIVISEVIKQGKAIGMQHESLNG